MVREKHKKSCDYSLQLQFVEPNNLFVSWRQIWDNLLATRVWGQILSKDNNFVPPSYLFLFVFCVILILPLLFCVLFTTQITTYLPIVWPKFKLPIYDLKFDTLDIWNLTKIQVAYLWFEISRYKYSAGFFFILFDLVFLCFWRIET